MTTFLLVRHGQTAWNREERFRGQIDVPLDEWGLKQVEATGQRIANQWQVDAIYASPLKRTQQTAQAIAHACDLQQTIHNGLLDINYGELAGLTPQEAAHQYPELAHAWREAPHTVCFPDGESLADVRARAERALTELATRHPNQTIALVTHVVVCRLLLCSVLGLENSHFWGFAPATASISVFEISGEARVLLAFNDTCHLAGLG